MFQRLTKNTPENETDPLGRVLGFYRFHVGELEILVVNDGFIGLRLPFLAANAPADEARSLLRAHGLGTEFAALSLGCVLVRTGDRLVLADTGAGTSEVATGLFGDFTGGLVPTMERLGIPPESVTDVVFSHSHPDHLGGTSSGGRLAFPDAQHHLPELEWEDLQRDDVPEPMAPLYAFAREQLRPAADNDGQLAFYGDDDELAPGIRAVATLGHSPGHHALLVESGGERLLLPFDVIAHPVLHLRHPEWRMAPDQAPVAVDTRRRLLEWVADEEIPVLVHHFPFPGLGRILRDGEAYRYEPTS